MKLKYLKGNFDYGQGYCCNDYSCSSPTGTGEKEDTKNACFPVSKYNIVFDFIKKNKDFRTFVNKEFADDVPGDNTDI
jgi:hypothetical protein